jgi:hypothetical protein
MPGPFAPSDPVVGAVMAALGTAITTQIPTITKVYSFSNSRSSPDGQVKLVFNKLKVDDSTNGKIKLEVMLTARHLFRLTEWDTTAARAQQYVYPWVLFLTAMQNQHLTSNMIVTNTSDVTLTQVPESGQAMVALIINFTVLTEINAVLT